jgi:hypothetical protein
VLGFGVSCLDFARPPRGRRAAIEVATWQRNALRVPQADLPTAAATRRDGENIPRIWSLRLRRGV